MNRIIDVDVLIPGGGVTATAIAYELAGYSSIKSVTIVEKEEAVAQVNSNPWNNAQTSHDGSKETNYNCAHALEIKPGATMLRSFVEQDRTPGLFYKKPHMVLGIGAAEVALLEKRYIEFKPYYPELRFVRGNEIATIEPKVMEGRDPNELVAAIVSDGYAINYEKLAQRFLAKAKLANPGLETYFDTEITDVVKTPTGYLVETNRGVTFRAKIVIFATGSYALYFAHMLGDALNLGLFMAKGDFYSAGKLLNGKVYRVQIEGLGFAEPHGDSDVLNEDDTRFGPTTRPVLEMEPRKIETFWDYLRMGALSIRSIWSLMRVLSDSQLFWYIAENCAYTIPYLGKWLFLKKPRAIVPTLRYRDLKRRKGAGGVRPQIVNFETGKLEMGIKIIVGDRAIYIPTPSPGASTCLLNGIEVIEHAILMLGEGHTFDKERLKHDHGIIK